MLRLKNWLEQQILCMWYGRPLLAYLFVPCSLLFYCIIFLRRLFYKKRFSTVEQFAVPIIVVGNITVGGTGKTPLVIALVKFLREQGYKPAVISRGYGGTAGTIPQAVTADSDPVIAGDEPVLIARRQHCPVIVAADRRAAVKALLADTDCNIIISDDGLQHYALTRDIEIAVVDAERQLGNKLLLPAGPLREPASRLQEADFIVLTHTTAQPPRTTLQHPAIFAMELSADALVNLHNPQQCLEIAALAEQPVYAVAGIGNPSRFFNLLRSYGLIIREYVFPDHHAFTAADFSFIPPNAIVIMTEKDAVKCKKFAQDNFWFLPVKAEVPAALKESLLKKLNSKLANGRN